MQRILFIFYLVSSSALQASDLPIDSLQNPAFHRKINFYLKYSTQREAQDVLHKLKEMELLKTKQLTTIDRSLAQEEYNYIDADNRSNKILSTMPDLYQAHEDKGVALWNYQCFNYNKSVAENDLMHIAILKQMMGIRKDRLKLKAEKRNLTAEQEIFHEQKMQIKRDESIQKNRAAQAEKNRITLALKLADSQSRALVQTEQRELKQKQGQQKDLELKALQSLAIRKGIKPALRTTEAERLAQSERDRNKATQQARESAEKIAEQAREDARKFTEQTSNNVRPNTPINIASIAQATTNNKTKSTKTLKVPGAPAYDPSKDIHDSFASLLQSMQYQPNMNHNNIASNFRTIMENAIALENKIDQNAESFYSHPDLIPLRHEYVENLNKIIMHYETAKHSIESSCKAAEAENLKRCKAVKKFAHQDPKKLDTKSRIQLNLLKKQIEDFENLGLKSTYFSNIETLARCLGEKNHKLSSEVGTIQKHLRESFPDKAGDINSIFK